jgi:plastocyanin
MSIMTATSGKRLVGLALALTTLSILLPGPTPAWAAGRSVVGAFLLSYVPDVTGVTEGSTITFVNSDPFGVRGHTYTQATLPGVAPRFDSDIAMPGQAVEVRGVEKLPPGEYPVACRIHPNMQGGLIVGRAKSP